MRSLASWVMIACLMIVQAHSFVPHHHHSDDAPSHGHPGHHHIHGDEASKSSAFNSPHPEVAPHDEPELGKVRTPQGLDFEVAILLPTRFDFILPSRNLESQRTFIRAEHPYSTGPPGTCSSRAPPSSSTA